MLLLCFLDCCAVVGFCRLALFGMFWIVVTRMFAMGCLVLVGLTGITCLVDLPLDVVFNLDVVVLVV